MIEESNIWYQYWIDKNLIDSQCDEISFVDLLAHCEYYPENCSNTLYFYITASNNVHNRKIVQYIKTSKNVASLDYRRRSFKWVVYDEPSS